MDTSRIKYFCVVAEVGTLTKASEILGISHSGLSKAISTLEIEIGFKLFQPLGRGLEITHDGKRFYQKAQEILKIENEILNGFKTQTSSIKIGLSEVLAVTCTPYLVKEFNELLTFMEFDVGGIEGEIIKGEIDFGFIFTPAPATDLDYLEIGEIKFSSFARQDLIKRNGIESVPFAVPASHFPFNPLGYKLRDGWPADLPRYQRFAVSGFSIAIDLLRSGEAAVYMPNFVAELENNNLLENKKIIKIIQNQKAESKRKLFLVKPKGVPESKSMKKASKVIRKICCS